MKPRWKMALVLTAFHTCIVLACMFNHTFGTIQSVKSRHAVLSKLLTAVDLPLYPLVHWIANGPAAPAVGNNERVFYGKVDDPFGYAIGQGRLLVFVVAPLGTVLHGIVGWGLGLLAEKRFRRRHAQPATPPYSEPAARSPQG